MLAAYFGFKGEPFDGADNSAFIETNLYLRGVAAQLLAGIAERKGLMLVLGDAASGRRLMLRHLAEELRGRCRTVHIACAPGGSFDDVQVRCCAELGIGGRATDRLARARLLVNHFITQIPEGRTTLLLVDDAENLDEDGLRNLFLLSELGERKPAQVILAGSGELDGRFASDDLATILRGLGLVIRLPALKPADFEAYLQSQLRRVGAPNPDLFGAPALERIVALLQEAPELIDRLCNQALVITRLEGQRSVSPETIEQAAQAVLAPRKPDRRPAAPAPPEAPPKIERPIVAMAPRPVPSAAPQVHEHRPVFVDPSNGAAPPAAPRSVTAPAAPRRRNRLALAMMAAIVLLALGGGWWTLDDEISQLGGPIAATPVEPPPQAATEHEALGHIATAAGVEAEPATAPAGSSAQPDAAAEDQVFDGVGDGRQLRSHRELQLAVF